MKLKTLKYFILILLITSACSEPKETKTDSPYPFVESYSATYQPPVFNTTNRAEKIKLAAPEIQGFFESIAADRKIPGISYGIVFDGELIVANSTGVINLENEAPATTNSVFRIASMSKSFTAMAIMKLRDEGRLSLDDPAVDYIPEMAKLEYLTSDAQVIRIQNLLTMSAGFPEDNPWGDRQLDEPDQMLMDLISEGSAFSTVTASQYEYSNTGFALLGNIISRVSGMPYQDYITINILEPLGMNNTYWEFDNIPKEKLVLGYRWEDEQWKDEPMLHDGSYGAMGGLFTTIEDFSKYVNFHLSAWPARSDADNGPVRRSSLREMHQPTYPRLNSGATDYNEEPCAALVSYGYGLRITKNCNGMVQVGHGGALPGFGSNYVFYPDYGIGFMAFGNLTYTGPQPLRQLEQLIFGELNLQPRSLPISEILQKRTAQVAELIQTWDSALSEEILAENFFLDKDQAHRKAQIDTLLAEAGTIQEIKPIENFNELRGRFEIIAKNGTLQVFFTMTPEKIPKVQQLRVSFSPN